MRDAIIQLRCCVFYKTLLTHPTSCNHCHIRQRFIKATAFPCVVNFFEEKVCGLYDFIWSRVRLMTSVHATGFRDPLDPCGTISVDWQPLWLTCSTRHLGHSSLITVDQACAPSAKNVSRTSCKLIDEDVTTYRERLANYLQSQRVGTSCKLFDEDVTMYQERLESYLQKMSQRVGNVLQVMWRRCCNVSGTSCKLPEENVTTYQERFATYSKKITT